MTEQPDPADQTAPTQVGPWSAMPRADRVEEEFTAFYRHQMPSLVAFLIWQGASPADATEFAQDTMTRAYQRWLTLTNPRAWARRTSSRAYARRLSSLLEDLVDEPVESALLVPDDADLHAFAEKHRVLELLRLLPPRQRQILAWTFDGYSPAEIADELGVSSALVRGSLRKARTRLARHLEQTGGDLP